MHAWTGLDESVLLGQSNLINAGLNMGNDSESFLPVLR